MLGHLGMAIQELALAAAGFLKRGALALDLLLLLAQLGETRLGRVDVVIQFLAGGQGLARRGSWADMWAGCWATAVERVVSSASTKSAVSISDGMGGD